MYILLLLLSHVYFTTMYLITILSYSFIYLRQGSLCSPGQPRAHYIKFWLASQSQQSLCLTLPGGNGHHTRLSHSYFNRTYFFYDLMYSMLGTPKNYPEDRF